MSYGRYVYTVMLPNLIFCSVFGKPAKAIEKVARKVRLACGRRMKRVMMDAPPKQSSES